MVEDLFAIALAYYRSPLEYPGLAEPTRPLAEDMGDFLQASGGHEPSESLLATAAYLDVSSQELIQAALFYIKQVLFAEGADYYRNLALPPTATDEEIKRHHRLLIRIFHPDREAENGEWNESYAPRVIEAYSTLGKADKRSCYDRQLLQQHSNPRSTKAARKSRPSPARVAVRQNHYAPPSVSVKTTRPWYLHTGMLSFYGLLLTVGVLLSLYYKTFEGPALLTNTPSVLPDHRENGDITSSTSSAADPSLPLASNVSPYRQNVELSSEEMVDILAGRSNTGKKTAKRAQPRVKSYNVSVKKKHQVVAKGVVANKNVAHKKEPAKDKRQSISHRSGQSKKTVLQQNTNRAVVSKKPGNSKNRRENQQQAYKHPVTGAETRVKAHQSEPGTKSASNASDSVTANAKPGKAPIVSDKPEGKLVSAKVQIPEPPQTIHANIAIPDTGSNNVTVDPKAALAKLLKTFAQAYAEGDLDTFIGLFARDARSVNESGRDSIRQDYGRLFKNSAARKLQLKDMQWTQNGETSWQGKGAFEVLITDQTMSSKKHLVGSARFVVNTAGQRLEISQFDYTVYPYAENMAISEKKKEQQIITSNKENLPQQQLTRIINQFVKNYEGGDLKAFVQLFSATAKTNKTRGRENIRQEYRKFFALSDSRKLLIRELVWKRMTDNVYQGTGKLEVYTRTGILKLKHHYTGNLQLKLERSQGRLQIAEFFYHVQ